MIRWYGARIILLVFFISFITSLEDDMDYGDDDYYEKKPNISFMKTSNVIKELKEHFTIGSSNINQMSETLEKIHELMHKKIYGNRMFSKDATRDKQKAIVISAAQPKTKPELSQFLFEGDIFLSPNQAKQLLDNLNSRQARSLTNDEDAFWKEMPIKYRFHESLTFFTISQIIEAIQFWEDNTCISFQNIQQPIDGDYIEFFKGQGCYSMIGKFGGRQGISIGEGCERIGVIEHEIGHALGLWHQQSRPDALDYIDFVKDYILPSYLADFEVRTNEDINSLGIPYDLGSVMHYGPTAFSVDGITRTLITKNPLYQMTIGQREKLSFFDLGIVNKAYCKDRCKGSKLECKNGGYIHPKTCKTCICPHGYGSELCDKNEKSINAECGDVITSTPYWNYIESPNYDDGGYIEDQMCSWIITAPTGKRIEISFVDEFAFLCTSTCMDYVEIKLQKDQRNTGPRFCCNEKPKDSFISESNQVAVIFRSQIGSDIGFRIGYKFTSKKQKNIDITIPPITTMKPTTVSGFNIWSEWENWSDCTRSCGACGIRSRNRACKSSECHGRSQEFSSCNTDTCPEDPQCPKWEMLQKFCNKNSNCQQIQDKLRGCNDQVVCCPPFFRNGNKCVSDKAVLGSYDN
uniref:Zinc metalloproteinase n=1 Tax=Parastrongyloides trichosuri TaxID=131310 RepID=A0A0N4ZMC0_PARTI